MCTIKNEMKESIIIKNLGPLKDIHIEDIKPFTLLIGESGSGKSSLMKCVSLFRYLFKMENIKAYLKNSKISKTPFRIHIMKHFKDSGLDEFISDLTVINYKVKFENGDVIELKFENKKYKAPSKISSSNLHFTKISFITENRNIIPLWASKGASLAGAYLGFYFHEVYKDFDLASDEIKTIELNHVGLNLVVKKSHKGKEYRIGPKDNKDFDEIEFKNSSSGTQSSTPITLISKFFSKHFNFDDAFNRSTFKYLTNADSLKDFKFVADIKNIKKKIYIHIEEPELSLYPDAQFKLMEDLISNTFINNQYDTNLFVSTHSPYIINHLNLMIKAFETKADGPKYDYSKLAVYQVANGRLQDLIVKNEKLVNTNPLSDMINAIYDKYNALG